MAFTSFNNPGPIGYSNYNRPQYSGGSVCGSFCGMIFGLFMFFSTIYLIYWNEGITFLLIFIYFLGYAVKTAESLEEGINRIKSLGKDDLNYNNFKNLDGQLVHISGFVDAKVISDPQFGVNIKAIKMERVVKMLQWIEKKQQHRTEVINQYNGNREVQRFNDYYHVKAWDTNFHDSSLFHQSREGFLPTNPIAMPYSSQLIQSSAVSIADLKLSSEVINLMEVNTNYPINEADRLPLKYKVINGKIQSWDAELSSPDIGDIIIEYQILPTSVFSIIGRIQDGSITSYSTNNGLPLIMVEIGSHSASDMFQRAEEWNNLRTWLLRGLALILMFVGFRLILDPLASIFLIIPILGPFLHSIIGLGVSVVAFGLAVSFTFVVSSLSWLIFRPILSVSLFVCAFIPLLLLNQQANNRNRTARLE